MIIDDGSGKGHQAKVDDELMLHTRSVRTHEALFAALHGNGFNVPWGSFTLTSATESALAYFLWSNTTDPAILSRQVFSFGPSTGGAGLARLRIVRKPTGGTIISNGTAITPVNTNFGSGNQATGTFKKGAQGLTVTGGTDIIDIGIPPNYFFSIADVNWVIGNGSSYVTAITPPTGNTSMVVYMLDKFYIGDEGSVT